MAESEETAKSADNQQSEQVSSEIQLIRRILENVQLRMMMKRRTLKVKALCCKLKERPDSKLYLSSGHSKRAIRERALKQAEESLKGKGKDSGDEKLYKGINSYTDYKAGFRREQTIASEKAGGAHGPLRASAHTRVSARFDYQPDICKDYKETG
ncbi:hypothetical protein L6164_022399 [Bauhinia variegata]|uniref:Uncharacterized protein n=1 Tax=Bauhinia variegata TaxID=167791 RepID=A0ACB9MF21_BAUVA|nr:hypothetical protein L6164_022399 [Bauhinia variegata]